jgi:hypothetical protein
VVALIRLALLSAWLGAPIAHAQPDTAPDAAAEADAAAAAAAAAATDADAAADAAAAATGPHPPRFRVALRHESERPLRLHFRERGAWRFVCTTPCEADAPFGPARLGVSLGEDERPTEVDGPPIDVTSDLSLSLSLETRDTEHVVGGVLGGLGLALLVATMVATVVAVTYGGALDRALPGSSITGGLALLITLPGGLTGLGLAISGVVLLGQPRIARAARERD